MLRLVISTLAAASVLVPAVATADDSGLSFDTEGYHRTRTVYLSNLAPRRIESVYPPTGEDVVIPDIRKTSYITSRLRITSQLSYVAEDKKSYARLHVQMDALDDVLWGDNNGISSAPLFATDAGNQNFLGGEADLKGQVFINKAWLEFSAKVGVMRVGRMPSHWGMGILANGGGNFNMDPDPTRPAGAKQRKHIDTFFDDDFGDNHFGSVTDRILFLTKPISVYKTITKQADTSSKLVVGYAFDKLSEAPLLGFEPFERRFRPFGQQGFISRGKGDDVNEHVVFAVWNDPFWKSPGTFGGPKDELRIGMYGVTRRSKEGSTEPSALDPNEFCGVFEGQGVPCVDTGSAIYIADLWWKLRYGPLYTEGELLTIRGTTFGGVPFPGRNEKKKASINGGVVRLGYFGDDLVGEDLFSAVVEVGHASGDDQLEDENFKQRALNPDYNVGLILFEETLRELSARTYGPPFFSIENPEGAKGLMSRGGVVNSNYLSVKGSYYLPGGMKVIGGVLAAWVDTLASTGTAMFYDGGGSYLGTEFDVAVKAKINPYMHFSLETGYLRFGSALKTVYQNADSSFSLQTRLAFEW